MANFSKTEHLGINSVYLNPSLNSNLEYLLELLRRILREFDPELLKNFDYMHSLALSFHDSSDISPKAILAFNQAVEFLDSLSLSQADEITRAFTCYFHLANLAEKLYRIDKIAQYEIEETSQSDPLISAFEQLKSETSEANALKHLKSLRFQPVLTAHPTEARRSEVIAKISRISDLMKIRQSLVGSARIDNERRILFEIDTLFRTSFIAPRKPTPIEEADIILTMFNQTFSSLVVNIVRKLDDYVDGNELEAHPSPFVPFIHIGSWIGADRDGNKNITAETTYKVSQKLSRHIIQSYREMCIKLAQNFTHSLSFISITADLNRLFERLVNEIQSENSQSLKSEEVLFTRGVAFNYENLVSFGLRPLTKEEALDLYKTEPYKAVILLIAQNIDVYSSPDALLQDLTTIQVSLDLAGAKRSAYGFLQTFIWTIQVFGFHLAETECRQHSKVHQKAFQEICSVQNPENLSEETKEVLDTFLAIGKIQEDFGVRACKRYIVSFTNSAEDIGVIYKLIEYAYGPSYSPKGAPKLPVIDLIPLFETLSDLSKSESILDEIIQISAFKQRLFETNNNIEIMFGYSDSSKEVGPVSATFAVDAAEKKLSVWAKENNLNLLLFHGRGGTLGRGGGSAKKAIIAQPEGSPGDRFKLTEQGEVIYERYGEPVLAKRHIESILASILLNNAPSTKNNNLDCNRKYADLRSRLSQYSQSKYQSLLQTDDFVKWFAIVTPLEEAKLLPFGSRPASRGLNPSELDDLRAIPWVFAWNQARVNLTGWYGFGTALAKIDDLDLLREAYKQWPIFSTLVDNTEMSIAKTDFRIAELYLGLGKNSALSQTIMEELRLTRDWILKIKKIAFPLEKNKTLAQAVRVRSPYIDALSLLQFNILKKLRNGEESPEQIASFQNLLLSTVSGISAGLQNTG